MPKPIREKYSQIKDIKRDTTGSCPHCQKKVNSLEAHIKFVHREKKPKEKIILS